ncbi:hypothetical protein Tco_0150636 [Tanacetum coccineum]
MALPEDHLAKFHKMIDAKEMWDAIKSRFGGNDESKIDAKRPFARKVLDHGNKIIGGGDGIEFWNHMMGAELGKEGRI